MKNKKEFLRSGFALSRRLKKVKSKDSLRELKKHDFTEGHFGKCILAPKNITPEPDVGIQKYIFWWRALINTKPLVYVEFLCLINFSFSF